MRKTKKATKDRTKDYHIPISLQINLTWLSPTYFYIKNIVSMYDSRKDLPAYLSVSELTKRVSIEIREK